MKKKVILTLVATVTAIALIGCGGEKKEETSSAPEATKAASPSASAESKADEGSQKTYKSEYGYSVSYNDDLFEVINDEGADSFQLKDQDLEKEVPVFVSISKADDTVKNLVEGLILQSGQDDLKADDTTMGKNSYPSKCITYDTKSDAGKNYETFHVLDIDKEVFLIEIGSGDDVEPQVQNAIEELLASFEATGESSKKESDESSVDYTVFTDLGSEKVQEFAEEIQKDFENEDWDSLSKKIKYPVTIGAKTFKTAKQFMEAKPASLFSDDFAKAVLDTDCGELFANGEGAMLGDGEVWFTESDGALKISALNTK